MAFDFLQAAGVGTDTIDKSVLGPPFISIIQKGSPEFDETHRQFANKRIEGCRPGQLVFEPTRDILPTPLVVIPIHQVASYTEWKPNKGGFAGNHDLEITAHRNYRRGIKGTPTEYREYLGQNELVYTITFSLLFAHKGEWNKGLIAFTSKQLKMARQWSKSLLGVKVEGMPEDYKAPIFTSKWELSTFPDSNEKGGWFAWQISKGANLNVETDQVILETAFTESKAAAVAALPKPQPTAALQDTVTPVDAY